MTDIPPLGVQISRLAALAPDRPAITCAGHTISRGELDTSSNRLARAYAELGIGQGDYLTIVLPNSIEFIQAAIAAWKLGAIPQPLSPRLPEPEFEAILGLHPRKLLVGRPDPSGAIHSIPVGFTPDPGLSDAELPDAVSPAWKVMASGGSTGRPKLIEVGSDSRVDLATFGRILGAEDNDTQLVSVPLTHNTGMMATVAGLVMGHHIVLMPRFEAEEFLRLVAQYRIDWMFTVPTIMHRALAVYDKNPDSFDLSSIRQIGHVGAPCPPTVKKRWIEILGPDAVWEVYGGTETQAFTVIGGREWLEHPGSVGKVTGGEMKIVDDQGRERSAGEVGEVLMRPVPGNPPAYRYIGATAKIRDGWDTLGDLGYFDSDGYLYLNDRRVDMFTVGGRNVYPAEIESTLSAHPDVLSCLVVGVPDDDLGQVPYALVQAEGLDEPTVVDFLAERIASYKVPRTVEFVDSPMRDDAGKARRSAVRDDVIARLSARADI
ncbi:AMP-binding protein [Mycolicibacterium septicum]|uniref:AMP-binding protein n=1 Tax=Mycolicibacterium septicum TaxID=98668 RepID=UPI002361A2C0|nr:AMP-binding protein [Mycolicibacterium septicum]